MLEVGVDHSVGEAFAANTDAFKYTVTGELVHNQVRIDDTWRETGHELVSFTLEWREKRAEGKV